MYLSGAMVDEICDGFRESNITPAKVHAALAYYYGHQDEIDAIMDDIHHLQQEASGVSNFLTSHEAATLLNVDHESRWIAQLCREGKLDCRKIGRDWLISRKSVEDYATQMGKSE